ncbi:MAG TPA: helix-turn-helix domain-containing protein [Vicinamibacterales bacterium]|nr:helix-turn-helix domain-containing protein [Vicinamibacterales bacterium]
MTPTAPSKTPAATHPHQDCEFREMLGRIGDKWSLFVIVQLEGMRGRRGRFSDLRRGIPGISQRMLTATLRHLERDGILTRHVFAEVPPRVEYELTELGRGLMDHVRRLVVWLEKNWPDIRTSRDRFDNRAARRKTTRLAAQSKA